MWKDQRGMKKDDEMCKGEMRKGEGTCRFYRRSTEEGKTSDAYISQLDSFTIFPGITINKYDPSSSSKSMIHE